MRLILTAALAVCMSVFCSKSSDSVKEESIIYEDTVTFELSFGDDETALESEYLLADPRAVGISAQNEILVLDESRIKVFDQTGKPVRIVGREGQGPGEFERAYRLNVGPNGHVSVKNYMGLSAFTPNLEFIHKKNYTNSSYYKNLKDERGWQSGIALYAIYFSENERVIVVEGDIFREGEGSKISQDFKVLIHEKDGVSKPVVEYVKEYVSVFLVVNSDFMFSNSFHFEFFGDLLWTTLPRSRIVYTDTGKDYEKTETSGTYRLTVLSLTDGSTKTLQHSYELLPIPENEIPEKGGGPKTIGGFNQASFDNFVDEVEAFKEEKEHCAPLRSLVTDREYLFAFTYKEKEKTDPESEITEVLADIFDMSTGEYVCSTYFPGIPQVIANGYAYYRTRGSKDEFPLIKKYRIDPKVYGK
ncbi:hypothetical protein ACFL7D_07185 [candidate division KSB1 bacterium]